MAKSVLGNISCPSCGGHAMQVSNDKNGAPFGFCVDCSQQLRIGGNARRVDLFRARYPWAAGTVTDTGAGHEQGAAAPVEQKQEPAQKKGFSLGGLKK